MGPFLFHCQEKDFMVDVLRENDGSVNDVTVVQRLSTVSGSEGEAAADGRVLLVKLILTCHKYGFGWLVLLNLNESSFTRRSTLR